VALIKSGGTFIKSGGIYKVWWHIKSVGTSYKSGGTYSLVVLTLQNIIVKMTKMLPQMHA
jgi:hypothetical protein